MTINWAVERERRTDEALKKLLIDEYSMDDYIRIANQSYEDYVKEQHMEGKRGKKSAKIKSP